MENKYHNKDHVRERVNLRMLVRLRELWLNMLNDVEQLSIINM